LLPYWENGLNPVDNLKCSQHFSQSAVSRPTILLAAEQCHEYLAHEHLVIYEPSKAGQIILNDLPKLPAIFIIPVFLIAWLSLWLPFAIWGVKKLRWRPFQPSSPAQKLPLLAALYFIAPLVLAAVCEVEGVTFAVYGVRWQAELLVSMLAGFTSGSLGLMLIFWLQSILGWIAWTTSTPDQALPTHAITNGVPQAESMAKALGLLLLALWVGWTEELIFRGFLQTQLEPASIWGTATGVSLFFALLHWVWEGSPVVLQLPGLWLMGMVLVLARQVDHGSIGLAWGLHAGWVWTIASLETWQLAQPTGKAPEWLTGYAGRPLAGAIGLGFLLLTAGGLWVTGTVW
jgi:membrane protease YdiL (CAAX protease family)